MLKARLYAAKYTRRYQDGLKRQMEAVQKKLDAGEEPSGEESEFSAKMVVDLLESWELTQDGKPCPLTVDFLADELGYVIIAQIIRGILEAQDPNELKASEK